MNSETQAPVVPFVSPRKLWFGMTAAVTAFALDGFLGFVISWRTCFIGHGNFGALSLDGVRWLLVGITTGLFVLSAGGGYMSYQHWRYITRSKPITRSESEGTGEFIAMLGVLCSLFMTVGIVWISIPLIMISICERGH